MNHQRYFYVCLYLAAISWGHCIEAVATERELSAVEADVIIQTEMAKKAARLAARKAELEAVPAESVHETGSGGRKIIMRRVEALEIDRSDSLVKATVAQPVRTRAEWQALMAAQPKQESISMSVTVYDHTHSEIIWRSSDERRREFTIWTNVDLNYLRPIGMLEWDDVIYSYFGFTDNIGSEAERKRIKSAEALGYQVESRWKAAPVAFSHSEPEYVVVSADPGAVPEKLYRQMDALLGYYSEHRTELEIRYKNSVTLQAARRKFLRENPPAPKQTMINFWKIEGETPVNKR